MPPTVSETAPARNSIAIADIRVGERHRRDLGGIAGLAASIAELGLLHPPVVTPDLRLIAGERRLLAAKALGWQTIPVTVLDLDAVVRGEFAENAERKDFTLSEAVAIKRALEPIERARAKERQAATGGKGRIASGKLPTATKGRAADKVAKATGMARRTLEKAEAVVDAAAAEPEKFGRLLAEMDRTGKVNGAHRRLTIARKAEAIRAEPPPLPGNGPYRVIVADPPWLFDEGDVDSMQRGIGPYPRMTIDEISAAPVASIAAPDCVLWLWTTNFHMLDGARAVLDAWGFAPVTILTWAKDKFGTGSWLRGQTEHAIMAVRGKPIVQLTNQSTRLDAPVRAHSQKPIEFYNLVESLCPASRYADVFSRYRHNENWDCHGDEAPQAAEESSAPIKGAACFAFAEDGLDLPEFLRRPLPTERGAA